MIAVELFKLIRRLRTWVSIGLICALPLAVAIFIAVTHLAPPPGQGRDRKSTRLNSSH